LESWADSLKKLHPVIEKCKSIPIETTKSSLTTIIVDDFHRQLLLEILTFHRILIEHSYNRYQFPTSDVHYIYNHNSNFFQIISEFLEVDDDEVIIAVLRVYEVFIKRHTFSRRASHEAYVSAAVLGKLFAISQGWSGKEVGLTLATCLTEVTFFFFQVEIFFFFFFKLKFFSNS
jgi:hypothetical protein